MTANPLSGRTKVLFHMFGAGMFVLYTLMLMSVLNAESCKDTMPRLYYMLFVDDGATPPFGDTFVNMLGRLHQCPWWIGVGSGRCL
jgi:hypothetical protein